MCDGPIVERTSKNGAAVDLSGRSAVSRASQSMTRTIVLQWDVMAYRKVWLGSEVLSAVVYRRYPGTQIGNGWDACAIRRVARMLELRYGRAVLYDVSSVREVPSRIPLQRTRDCPTFGL